MVHWDASVSYNTGLLSRFILPEALTHRVRLKDDQNSFELCRFSRPRSAGESDCWDRGGPNSHSRARGWVRADHLRKLLRVLQDSIVEPVGLPIGHKVDVRLIAATNVDVQSAIKDGDLREDLYYRLKVGVCHLPPLRQRRSDIPRLALFLLDRFNSAQGKAKRFSTESMTWLRQQAWPGNIRELQNTIESAALFARPRLLRFRTLRLPPRRRAQRKPRSRSRPRGSTCRNTLSACGSGLLNGPWKWLLAGKTEQAKLLGVTPQALSKSLQIKVSNKS